MNEEYDEERIKKLDKTVDKMFFVMMVLLVSFGFMVLLYLGLD